MSATNLMPGAPGPIIQPERRVFRDVWAAFMAWLVRFILRLAAKRQERFRLRAERKIALRVISDCARCRGCGVTGEKNWRGQTVRPSVRIEFMRIQSTNGDPAIAAIRLTCLRCAAYWYEPTVQDSTVWVVKLLPGQKEPK